MTRTILLLAAAAPFAHTQITYDRLLNAAQEPQNWLTYSG